jgi:hypothetical protein
MRRRDILISGLAAGVAAPAMAQTSPLRAAAREAFLYALPLTEIAVVRGRALDAGLPVGRFHGTRGLATARDRGVTTPNADTLYATAFIDLTHGPAALTVPPLGGRYGSLALMDMFSDNIAVLGSRTTGPDGGRFTLVGPTAAAEPGAVRSPTPWVWALVRVLVNGPADVAAAQAVLRGFVCEGAPGPSRWAPGAGRTGPWQAWMKAASDLLVENPPPATDRRIIGAMAPLGLGAAGFDPERFSGSERAEIAQGRQDAEALARSSGFNGRRIGRWRYPAPDNGDFRQDYVTRARVAVGGLAALPTAEAMYLTALSPQGDAAFDGEGLWRLSFAAGALPPVDGFWSLTLYEAEPDGAFFLTPNSIDRYAIGDRTTGLAHGSDGALDIWISRTDPGGARSANWLPAPARGPFSLVLRAYLPRNDLIMQSYTPPPIDKV